jgi:pimeloyl-ACP methyl ester carboxylesterase
MKTITLLLFILLTLDLQAQQVKEFFYQKAEDYEFPVFVRGNLDSNVLILFVQGGPGETAIDFARSDYPRWKESLEKKFAIAYYDQRGLNQRLKNIDSTNITYEQYSKDIIALGRALMKKYSANIYLMGHSAGGQMVLNTLKRYPEKISYIRGAIALNTAITTDHSSERWSYYRPLYLKNLAKEKMKTDADTHYWRKAYEWIMKVDSIDSPEHAKRWNKYVDTAFTPSEKKISMGMVFRVIFSRPYNPIKYLKSKDNKRVSDLLWKDGQKLSSFDGLENIEAPVLLLTGRYDDIGLPEENRRAHQLIPNSTLTILPDAGHESFLDRPELFTNTIQSFIENER